MSAIVKNRRRRVLLGVNVLLLGALGWVVVEPMALGQNSARARGSYTLVGGEIPGGTSNAIYVLDATNGEMIALRWDQSRNALVGVGYRDLASDTQAEPGR
ncbi:MAG: hypothetical protein AAF995_09155 [Planctomycetota bacterium]